MLQKPYVKGGGARNRHPKRKSKRRVLIYIYVRKSPYKGSLRQLSIQTTKTKNLQKLNKNSLLQKVYRRILLQNSLILGIWESR